MTSNFKSKNSKDTKNVNQATLDKTHRNIMNAFSKEEEDLLEEIKQQECFLNDKESMNALALSNKERKIKKEELASTHQKLNELKRKKNKYILDNYHIIFKYFNLKKQTEIETSVIKEKKTEDGQQAPPEPISFGKQRIRDFFNKTRKQNAQKNGLGGFSATASADGNSQQNIVSKYLSNVDENYVHDNAALASSVHNYCVYCKKGKLLISDDDGFLVCDHCAASVTYIPENEKQSYKEPPKELGTFLYDRSNHFKEILAQFQAKETTYIADTVIEKCRLQIKKERLSNEQLTYYKMREILRNLGYDSKFYEHIPFIKNKLGIPPPVLSRELEMKLCKMFDETLVPFSKHQDESRCNYIHYYFAFYKMYELLGETKYAKDIPMLKEPGIFMSQDEIWKNICAELNWKFIPTSFNIVGGDI